MNYKTQKTRAKLTAKQPTTDKNFLETVIESIPHPFFVIDANTYTVKMANTAALDSAANKETTCYVLAHKQNKPCGSTDHPCPLEIIKKSKKPVTVEHSHYDENNDTTYVEIHAFPIFDRKGNVIQIIEYCVDITKRKQAEDALLKVHNELEQRVLERTYELVKVNRQLTETIKELERTHDELRKSREILQKRECSLSEAQRIAHLGNWDWDIVTNKLSWSDEIYRIFGLQPQEFGATYDAFLESVHPEDRESVKRAVNESLADPGIDYNIEHRIILADGSERFVQERGEVTFDENGKAVRMIGTVHDITERKQAEEALRRSEAALRKSKDNLRFLAGKLLSAQEEEHRRLARAMHDDFTQRLAVLAIEAGKLEQELTSSSGPFGDRLGQMKQQIVKLSADVHDISRQLHPAILDDLGLIDAVKSECAGFSKREGISIKPRSRNMPEFIPKNVALCIYRIMQESLRNIAKHANVNDAEVSLAGVDGGIQLCVRDNGVGFNPADIHGRGTLGLASMEERVRLIQGRLTIQSEPGQGTTITIWAPLAKGKK